MELSSYPPKPRVNLVVLVLGSAIISSLVTALAVYTLVHNQSTTSSSDLQAQITSLSSKITAVATPVAIATPTATPVTTSSPSVSTVALAACLPGAISISLLPSGGAAGTYYFNLAAKNTGQLSCTLSGAPTISALNSTGVEVGKTVPAAHTTTPITLVAGASAYSLVGFPNSGNFAPGICKSMKSLSIFLPGQTTALPLASIDTYNSAYTSAYCQDLTIKDFTLSAK